MSFAISPIVAVLSRGKKDKKNGGEVRQGTQEERSDLKESACQTFLPTVQSI